MTVEALNSALDFSKTLQPDLVILDLPSISTTCLQFLTKLRETLPAAGIIALSLFDDVRYREMVLKAGATRFISKTEPRANYLNAIREICPLGSQAGAVAASEGN